MKLYKYGFRLRPPSLATQPNDFVDISSGGINGYWGFVVYKRELTNKEIYEYDLDFIQEVEND